MADRGNDSVVLYAGYADRRCKVFAPVQISDYENQISDLYHPDFCQYVSSDCAYGSALNYDCNLYGIRVYAGHLLSAASVLYAPDVYVLDGVGTLCRSSFRNQQGLSEPGAFYVHGAFLAFRNYLQRQQSEMFMFWTAWGLFAGLLSAISKDFLNLVRSMSTALFWLSGIIYSVSKVKYDWIKNILLFNPVTLIANGYRNCFVYKKWFWESPQELLNFGIVLGVMVLLAVWAYKKLRKEIPDVL